jgi:hypothetical protein
MTAAQIAEIVAAFLAAGLISWLLLRLLQINDDD